MSSRANKLTLYLLFHVACNLDAANCYAHAKLGCSELKCKHLLHIGLAKQYCVARVTNVTNLKRIVSTALLERERLF